MQCGAIVLAERHRVDEKAPFYGGNLAEEEVAAGKISRGSLLSGTNFSWKNLPRSGVLAAS